MKETIKQEITVKFLEGIQRIGEIKNPTLSIIELMKMSKWVSSIFEDGYNKGFDEGRKSWVKDIPKN